MPSVDTLRERAISLLEANTPEATDKAAALLKTVSDIEQQKANSAKLLVERSKLSLDRQKVRQDLKDPYRRAKDLITAVTPLFTTAILAGTLIVQMRSANQADVQRAQEAAQKREDAKKQADQVEKARFATAVTEIGKLENISPSVTLLTTFTAEPYKGDARQLALKLLLRAKTLQDFKETFSAAIEPVQPSDLALLAQLNRSIYNTTEELERKFADPKTNELDKAKMSPALRDTDALLTSEIEFVSEKMSLLILQTKQGSQKMDLSGTHFRGAPLKGARFGQADLRNAQFQSVNLDDADLSEVDEFEPFFPYDTAWWHAKRISPSLLQYLRENWPYKAGFYATGVQVNPDEYRSSLERLAHP